MLAVTAGAMGAGAACLAILLGAFLVRALLRKQWRGTTSEEAAEATSSEWDYIIVGGGTAGCVLANRLTKGPAGKDKRVLLLEAGRGDYDNKLVQIPAGILRLFQSDFDWHFYTSNEKATSGRGIYLCRGKCLGGSSCVNVTLYTRGDAHDYDTWEKDFKCTGWSAAEVLPHFRRTEDDQIGLYKTDPKHHGSGGEMSVDNVRYQNPLSAKFLEACKQAGHKLNPDFNCWDSPQTGAGRFAVSQRNGARCSAASALLAPALAEATRGLKVLTGVLARKVVFKGTKTTGVQFSVEGVDFTANLKKGGEVILAGGAIHSPQLLMLSGIGPAEHLKSHSIPVISDLSGVGQNLQDHPAAAVAFECPEDYRGISVTSAIRIAGTSIPHPWPLINWFVNGSGPLTSTGCDHGGFFTTEAAPANSSSADLQMRFLAARAVSADGMRSFTSFKKTTRHPDGFTFQAIAARPESRGRVLLASAQPETNPVIEGGFLTHKQDVASIRAGLRLARKLAQQPALKPYAGREVFPGESVQTDEQLDEYIASSVHTANALVGTCRMGELSDPLSVVDPEMRVKGVQGLRVVDASVIPKLPGGQSNSCVVMIAERAAASSLAFRGNEATGARLTDPGGPQLPRTLLAPARAGFPHRGMAIVAVIV
eukprot:CAMPEP_0170645850 /NCGR_PEP_ID=MMETSP0224-20130122/43317_1 /TAXON_ID=285029 /ORGANISM="Togula jolla, Strain CCCM 725" /LENGTH=650 /DNA_ID=CAMNT_0010977129 /DNA_START=63 /DNA_END=2017 /DNA_ORIENTATION=-